METSLIHVGCHGDGDVPRHSHSKCNELLIISIITPTMPPFNFLQHFHQFVLPFWTFFCDWRRNQPIHYNLDYKFSNIFQPLIIINFLQKQK